MQKFYRDFIECRDSDKNPTVENFTIKVWMEMFLEISANGTSENAPYTPYLIKLL